MKLTWLTCPRPGNFGDILTPYLFKKYGYEVTHVPWSKMHEVDAISIGSIARIAVPGTRVLGSGVMQKTEIICPEASWEWVRGPITRQIVLEQGADCPELYGDPALLLPRVYTPNVEKEHKVGYVPHHVHYEEVKNQNPDAFVINLINGDVTKVIDDINRCESIVSSSLHGLIAAHAYSIPARWAEYSKKLVGDNSKFRDYYQSVGIYDNYKEETLPDIDTEAIHQKMKDLC